MLTNPIVLSIVEASQVGEARRKAIALADHLGFNETERGKISIVITEVANNLVRHARDGVILLQAKIKNDILGIEILSLDSGPGINNIDECLRDGFSTTGTPGNGLGAIIRLSDFCDIYSLPNIGTALVTHSWAKPLPPDKLLIEQLEIGVVCLPKTGEEVSGDAWTKHQQSNRSLLLIADGLGHGTQAAKASSEAVRILQENIYSSGIAIMLAAHNALKKTRGAAVAIAHIDFASQVVRYTGIGNIVSTILTTTKRYNMISHNGTVGFEARKIQEFIYPWSKESVLVMHSDGLKTQWRLEHYPGLINKHPSLIAGILYRDFNRGRDDVTVLVAREELGVRSYMMTFDFDFDF